MCEIILNLGQQFRNRCCFKILLFLALTAILLSGANLVEGCNDQPLIKGRMTIRKEHLCEIILNLGKKFLLFQALVAILFDRVGDKSLDKQLRRLEVVKRLFPLFKLQGPFS